MNINKKDILFLQNEIIKLESMLKKKDKVLKEDPYLPSLLLSTSLDQIFQIKFYFRELINNRKIEFETIEEEER